MVTNTPPGYTQKSKDVDITLPIVNLPAAICKWQANPRAKMDALDQLDEDAYACYIYIYTYIVKHKRKNKKTKMRTPQRVKTPICGSM